MTLPRLGSGPAAQAGIQTRLEQLAHPLYPDLLHALAQYRWLSQADQLLDDSQWRGKTNHLRTRTDAIAAQQRRLSGVAECPWGTLPHVDDAMVRGVELFTLAVREIRHVHSEAVDALAAARQDVAEAAQAAPAPRMPERARRKRNAVRGRVEDALDAVHSHMASKRRRGRLPEASTRALLHWFMEHADNPYPTAEEKAELRSQTGLNNQQLRNWFTNMRKRHWKPTRTGREPQSAVDWLIHEKQAAPEGPDAVGPTKYSAPQPARPRRTRGAGAGVPPHGGGGGPASSPVPFRAPHHGARPGSPAHQAFSSDNEAGSHTAAAAVAAAAASAASIQWESWAGAY